MIYINFYNKNMLLYGVKGKLTYSFYVWCYPVGSIRFHLSSSYQTQITENLSEPRGENKLRFVMCVYLFSATINMNTASLRRKLRSKVEIYYYL